MTGRRERCCLRWLGLLVWVGLWLCTGRVAAQEVRVLLLSPAHAELTARIRGQTRDLGIVLEQAEPSAALSAAEAKRAGAEHQAEVVVWAEAGGAAELRLHILELETGQLRSRVVSTPANETLASSTTAEMGALVVRSELAALLAEQRARREVNATAVPEPEPHQAPPPPKRVEPVAPPALAAPVLAPSGPWLLGLGYRLTRPLKGTLTHGLGLGVRRDLAGFALGLHAAAALPASLSRNGTRITLQRTQLAIDALKQWQLTERLRLGLGIVARVAFDRRTTELPGESLLATQAAVHASGAFGLFLELQWLFARGVGGFVAGGADAVPWRTRFVVRDGTEQRSVARLSWLDPWCTVGLFTRFGG